MTIAEKAGEGVQRPLNLLGLAGQGMQIANARNQLLKFSGEQAAGQDYLRSLGANGIPDQQRMALEMRNDANPYVGMAAPQMTQNVLNSVQTALQNKGLTLNQGLQRLEYANSAIGAILANPKATRSDIVDALVRSMKAVGASAPEIASEIAGLPQGGPDLIQANPELKNYAQQRLIQAKTSLDALSPHVVTLNNGEKLFVLNTNPGAGQVGTVGETNMGLPPATAASPQTITGPNGQPITTTVGQIAAHGNQLPTGAGFAPVVGGPTQIQSAANAQTGAAAGQMTSQIFGNVEGLAQSRAAMQGILSEVDSANPGPMGEYLSKIGAAVGQLGIKGLDQASAYQLLQKGSAQLVVSQVGSGLGVVTDSKMGQVLAQIPHGTMTPDAIRGAAGMIQGIFDYKQAEAQAAQSAGLQNNPSGALEFQNKWTKEFPNAGVFQFYHLPMGLKQKYWKALGTNERAAFQKQYQDAASQGFVPANPFGQ